jgi:hypothetical protein
MVYLFRTSKAPDSKCKSNQKDDPRPLQGPLYTVIHKLYLTDQSWNAFQAPRDTQVTRLFYVV